MNTKQQEVRLVRFPLKKGKLTRFYEWMQYLNEPKNRGEIIEGIGEAEIFAESVFLSEEAGHYYVYYYMNSENPFRGHRAVSSGNRSADIRHFRFFAECIDMENHVVQEALFHVNKP
ncbi:hypothetical protein SAMN02927921_02471 [Sinomicrobium oceani]|uniref:Uncharacterized protein n=1 Tax=Sinomicrobium oceani TaxID=1150368 RepID=A0A1K1QCP7_9FLAO|nr:DUF6176 family protein [Sinomicrobium oceani]SFW57696.1 hypothetical protein SAMN02927921_02471 [Sinomicrobium oceani]